MGHVSALTPLSDACKYWEEETVEGYVGEHWERLTLKGKNWREGKTSQIQPTLRAYVATRGHTTNAYMNDSRVREAAE